MDFPIISVPALLLLASQLLMSGAGYADSVMVSMQNSMRELPVLEKNQLSTEDEPSIVTLSRSETEWALQVNGQPFTVKGAGMGYSDDAGIASLATAGGNAFRTWETENLDAQLAAAQRHGLMVLAGLGMHKQLQGFDYNNREAVAEQLERVKAIVDRYKDHPSLLGWIIANEPNLMIDENGAAVQPDSAVYDAMSDVLNYIQKEDGNHPATVAFAFTAALADDVALALEAMPTLDFLSFQAYGALPVIASFVNELDVDLPYMVTEYGPLGHWEMPSTQWGREIEELSHDKAVGMAERINKAGLDNPSGQLLGGFAFLWGYKQERTPTWYGLFTEDGGRTAAVDELTRVWTGTYPPDRAPSAWSMTLNDLPAGANVTLPAGEVATAMVQIRDPEADPVTVRWRVMNEVQQRSHGGHYEATPEWVDVAFAEQTQVEDRFGISLNAPEEPGEYRLYVWAHDENGGVATANFPFMVSAAQ